MKTTRNITLLLVMVLTMIFVAALVAPVTAEDTFQILTGKITKAGTLEADNGEKYQLSGDMAGELKKNIDKKVEIKGTLMGKPGEMTIEVQSFKLVEEPSIKKSPEPKPMN